MSADLIQKILVSVAAAGVGDSTVAVDVPNDGFIESMFVNMRGNGMDALGDSYGVELSFASSNTFNSNDSRITMIQVGEEFNVLTSGASASGIVASLIGIDIPVNAGERLHVHTAVAGGTTNINGVIFLYYSTRGARPARRTTRRR